MQRMRRSEFGPPTLIVSDVDGTLIDDHDIVRPLTVRAVEKAASVGVPLVLATGRPPRWLSGITRQVDTGPYAVCANGAIVYDIAADQVLYAATLEPEVLREIAAVAYDCLPGCGLAAERVGRSAYDAATAPFVATAGYEHAWLNPDHLEVGDPEVVAAPAVKLLVRHTKMRSHEMAAVITAAMADAGLSEVAAVTFSTDHGLIELARPDVNKATGLQQLSAITNLSVDRVIAFGDMPNDREMLVWAAHGVAVGNAHPLAKDAANEIATTNNNDAVGRVLRRWFG